MKTAEMFSLEERTRGFSHAFKITFADLTAAGLTQTLSLVTGVIAGDLVDKAAFYLKTPFTGGAGTALLMEVGFDGAAVDDPDAFLAGSELNSAGTEILAGDGDGAVFATLRTGHAFVEAASITALFTATTANLNTLTAGEVHVFLNLIRLSKAGGF